MSMFCLANLLPTGCVLQFPGVSWVLLTLTGYDFRISGSSSSPQGNGGPEAQTVTAKPSQGFPGDL